MTFKLFINKVEIYGGRNLIELFHLLQEKAKPSDLIEIEEIEISRLHSEVWSTEPAKYPGCGSGDT